MNIRELQELAIFFHGEARRAGAKITEEYEKRIEEVNSDYNAWKHSTSIDVEIKDVKSSNIAKIGYDVKSHGMRVQFQNGGLYHYCNVPQEEYDAMLLSESIGSYLGRNIKGKYECTKLI